MEFEGGSMAEGTEAEGYEAPSVEMLGSVADMTNSASALIGISIVLP